MNIFHKGIHLDNHKSMVQWLDKYEVLKYCLKPNISQNKLIVSSWWQSGDIIQYGFMKSGQPLS